MSKKRILQFLENQNLSKYRFYKDTGISNGALDKESILGADKYELICSSYPEINPTWLLTGEGSMLKEDKKQVAEPVQAPRDDKYVALLEKTIETLEKDKAEKDKQINKLLDKLNKERTSSLDTKRYQNPKQPPNSASAPIVGI